MIDNFSLENVVFCKEPIIMPKIASIILPEIIYFRKRFDAKICGQMAFIDGYYTSLKFPQESISSIERQAQRMNYEYCVRTMAELMKKYAPEILK